MLSNSDSDYEDGDASEELQLAQNFTANRNDTAYQDGYREGVDQGQTESAQFIFNEHCQKSAKEYFTIGKILGYIKYAHQIHSCSCKDEVISDIEKQSRYLLKTPSKNLNSWRSLCNRLHEQLVILDSKSPLISKLIDIQHDLDT